MSTVRDSEQAKNYVDRGIERRLANDLTGALAEYNTAIELDPQNAEAYNNRGNVYTLLEDRPRAMADYTKAIQLNPEYAIAYYNRGLEKQLDGDVEPAVIDYTAALSLASKLQPTASSLLANIHYNFGLLYETKGDHTQGLAHFDEAIKYDSRHVSAYYDRGNVCERNGDFTKAIADYKRVLELVPDHRQSYYMQGLINLVEGLQADLRTHLSHYTADIDKAAAELWPLIVKALEGVQFNLPIDDPFALLDDDTVEALQDQKLAVNGPTDPTSTERRRAGNGN